MMEKSIINKPTIEYYDFIIDYSLFLINNFKFDKKEAYENAQSWWDFFYKNGDKIKSFRISKNGKPSIQTYKKIIIDDEF